MLARARALLLTDIDGSMIGLDGSREGVGEAVALLNSLDVAIVPVTTKTIEEVSYLASQLGFGGEGLIAVVEMGGAICATRGYLSFSNPMDIGGFECEALGSPIAMFEGYLDDVLRECSAVRLSKASQGEAEEILGLRGLEAILATRRVFLEVIWSRDRGCLERISRRLEARGLNTFMWRRFLHVGLHRGKGVAVVRLLELLRPLLKGRVKVIGVGDSEADKEFLETVGIAIVIPQEDGRQAVGLQRADYIVAPYPAPKGWVWASHQIAYNIL